MSIKYRTDVRFDFTYFRLNESSGNPTIDIKELDYIKLKNNLDDILLKNRINLVYLFCFDDEIIVTENFMLIELVYNNFDHDLDENQIIEIHLQEYHSYEAAYEVALMMKEVNALCYDIDPNDN